MKTVIEHIFELKVQFNRLSQSRRYALKRAARLFIWRNPGCADHSNFWRGLSARQVVGA